MVKNYSIEKSTFEAVCTTQGWYQISNLEAIELRVEHPPSDKTQGKGERDRFLSAPPPPHHYDILWHFRKSKRAGSLNSHSSAQLGNLDCKELL